MFRALFPTWSFFDNTEFVCELMVRTRRVDLGFGAWQSGPSASKRSWLSLFWNPQGNYRFYENTLVENFLRELRGRESENIQAWPIYLKVRHVAERYALELDTDISHYQIGIFVKRTGEEDIRVDEILVSPEYGVSRV